MQYAPLVHVILVRTIATRVEAIARLEGYFISFRCGQRKSTKDADPCSDRARSVERGELEAAQLPFTPQHECAASGLDSGLARHSECEAGSMLMMFIANQSELGNDTMFGLTAVGWARMTLVGMRRSSLSAGAQSATIAVDEQE